MGRTRLLQITHDLHVGGLPRVVDTLCRTIDRSRFDVEVLCLRDVGPLGEALRSDLGIAVHRLREDGDVPDRLAFMKIARFLRGRHFDVLHTHNTEPFVEGSLGGLLARVRTLVHTDHARPFPERWFTRRFDRNKRRYLFAEWLASHFAWKVVGVSDHTTETLQRYGKIASSKVETIVNGIEGDRYDLPIDHAEARRELGIPADAPVLGFASRLVEQKGLVYLFEALPAVRAAHPGAILLVAGEGNRRASLEAQARELGLTDAIRFLGVRLDVASLLKVFDLHVLPSLWEGLPMIILESMASGCATVATAVGGVPTAITDGRTGRLVPPKDPDALARTIIELLDDEEQRRALGEAARRRFQKRFTAEIMARQYEALYLRQPLPTHG
ncbi:MAG: glycosyltransferase [Gemmatimonadetes bacterium]|nr:glycosyltransferase [Gemmatimonadota bacterium]